MNIAITGHSTGIGEALAKQYERRGHEITGLSKRHGHNIRSIPKIASLIEPCDMFINNAQAGFSQTELLFEMAKRWGGTNKWIINISTQMTQQPISPLDGLDMDEYRVQKFALEEAVKQIRYRKVGVRLVIVRPGNISTPNNTKDIPPSVDCNRWAEALVQILELCGPDMFIPDITLSPL